MAVNTSVLIPLIKEIRNMAEEGHTSKVAAAKSGGQFAPAVIGLKEAKDFVEKCMAAGATDGPGSMGEINRLKEQNAELQRSNAESQARQRQLHAVEVARLEGKVEVLEDLVSQLLAKLSN